MRTHSALYFSQDEIPVLKNHHVLRRLVVQLKLNELFLEKLCPTAREGWIWNDRDKLARTRVRERKGECTLRRYLRVIDE